MELEVFRAWTVFGAVVVATTALVWAVFELRHNRRVLANQIAALRRSVYHMENQLVQTQPMYQCDNFAQRQPGRRANSADPMALN